MNNTDLICITNCCRQPKVYIESYVFYYIDTYDSNKINKFN